MSLSEITQPRIELTDDGPERILVRRHLSQQTIHPLTHQLGDRDVTLPREKAQRLELLGTQIDLKRTVRQRFYSAV